MKKRILSLALVLVMCLGLAIPVAAASYELKSDKCVYELSNAPIGKTFTELRIMDFETWTDDVTVEFPVYIVPDNTTLISKTAPEGRLYYRTYSFEEKMWFGGDFWTEEGETFIIKPKEINDYVGKGYLFYQICSQDMSDPEFPERCDNGVCVMAESAARAMGISGLSSDGQTPAEKEPGISFIDVAETSPYKDAINWAVEQNIAAGYSDGTFKPGDNCTMLHILTFLWRYNGGKLTAETEREAVFAWALENGMIMESWNLDADCTRLLAMEFLWEAKGRLEAETAISFTDMNGKLKDNKAVAWAVENGITTGTTATTFSPHKACTRGQIVTFLYRASK